MIRNELRYLLLVPFSWLQFLWFGLFGALLASRLTKPIIKQSLIISSPSYTNHLLAASPNLYLPNSHINKNVLGITVIKFFPKYPLHKYSKSYRMPRGRKHNFEFFRSWQNTLVFHGVKQEANCGYESSECTDAKVIICNSKFLEEAPTVFGVFCPIWARV